MVYLAQIFLGNKSLAAPVPTLDINTLNIIKFPISKFESIYRAKTLQHKSPYHIYSALFSYELIVFVAKLLHKHNPNEMFRIGVIAPYRAQADLLDKLLSAEQMPSGVEVNIGTIHGFQGDECDIVIVLFNTPPSISGSKDMFLNKKNIINVAISRARDYLIVIMPDDQTDNIEKLHLVKRAESIIRESNCATEFDSHYIESVMFDNDTYLEENSFSTSHQVVNVYGLPEKKYEIRTEDAAVDIQIHR